MLQRCNTDRLTVVESFDRFPKVIDLHRDYANTLSWLSFVLPSNTCVQFFFSNFFRGNFFTTALLPAESFGGVTVPVRSMCLLKNTNAWARILIKCPVFHCEKLLHEDKLRSYFSPENKVLLDTLSVSLRVTKIMVICAATVFLK